MSDKITTEEAAKILGIERSSVLQRINRKALPAEWDKTNNVWMIDTKDLSKTGIPERRVENKNKLRKTITISSDLSDLLKENRDINASAIFEAGAWVMLAESKVIDYETAINNARACVGNDIIEAARETVVEVIAE